MKMREGRVQIESSRHDNGSHVVVPVGDLDSDGAPALTDVVRDITSSGGRRVVLDLAQVPFMDSSGLVAVMNAGSLMREHEGELRLAVPSVPVQRLLGLTRMDTLFRIFPTREAALNGASAGAATR